MDLQSRPVSLLGVLLTFASAATGLTAAVTTFATLTFIGVTTDSSDTAAVKAFSTSCILCVSLGLFCGAQATTAAHFFMHREKDLRRAILLQVVAAILTCGYAVFTFYG